jgi:hypothetical protein
VAVTPLMTLPQVQANLGLSFIDSTEQAKYQAWLNSIDAAVRTYCKWDLQYHTGDVQYYNGNGQTNLVLRTPYLLADGSLQVYLDMTGYSGFGTNPFAAATLLTIGTDYIPRIEGVAQDGVTPQSKSALLMKLRNVNSSLWWPSDQFFRQSQPGGLAFIRGPYWPAGQGNIKVVCNYGFSTTPADIQQAIVNWLTMLRGMVQRGVIVSSQNIAGYSYSAALGQFQELGSIRQLLANFRDAQI